MPRASAESTVAILAAQQAWSPTDLGFNGINWTKPGVQSFDIMAFGYREFMAMGISDNPWILSVTIYDENGANVIFGPQTVCTDIGVSGGQIHPTAGLIGPIDWGYAYRIRLVGFAPFAPPPSPNSKAWLFARG